MFPIGRSTLLQRPDDESPATSAPRYAQTLDHLANERTFLIWLGLSLHMMTLGLAAGQFLTGSTIQGVPLTRTLALALVGSGIIAAIVGQSRYRRSYVQIEEGRFRPAWETTILTTVLIVTIGLLAVIFILLLR